MGSKKQQSESLLWTAQELKLLRSFKTPDKVQAYLDQLRYRTTGTPHSVRFVIRNKTANCFDGALFAAAVFEQHGHIPCIIDLRAVEDDDHLLAVFKHNNCYGAVAKSNYSGLRYREPVYRTLRELAMSYFENYFNLSGKRTLREYSNLYDLRREKRIQWRTGIGSVIDIGEHINAGRHYHLLSNEAEKSLVPVDRRCILAGKLGRQEK